MLRLAVGVRDKQRLRAEETPIASRGVVWWTYGAGPGERERESSGAPSALRDSSWELEVGLLSCGASAATSRLLGAAVAFEGSARSARLLVDEAGATPFRVGRSCRGVVRASQLVGAGVPAAATRAAGRDIPVDASLLVR